MKVKVEKNNSNQKKSKKTKKIKFSLETMVDQSISLLKGNARSRIQKFGKIINVEADGNCAIHSIQMGLKDVKNVFAIDPGEFRKQMYDWIEENHHLCCTNLNFNEKGVSLKMKGKKKTDFIEREVKQRIWSDDEDFSEGCRQKHWVNCGLHFPIISEMFSVNVVWYDVECEITSAVFSRHKQKGNHGNVQEHYGKKGYHDPHDIVKFSIYSHTIAVLYYKNHCQYVKIT